MRAFLLSLVVLGIVAAGLSLHMNQTETLGSEVCDDECTYEGEKCCPAYPEFVPPEYISGTYVCPVNYTAVYAEITCCIEGTCTTSTVGGGGSDLVCEPYECPCSEGCPYRSPPGEKPECLCDPGIVCILTSYMEEKCGDGIVEWWEDCHNCPEDVPCAPENCQLVTESYVNVTKCPCETDTASGECVLMMEYERQIWKCVSP